MMDDRKQRLGQHAAQTTPAWAITTIYHPQPNRRSHHVTNG